MRIFKDVMTLLTGAVCATVVTLLITLLVVFTISLGNQAEAAVYYPDDKTVIARWDKASDDIADVRILQQKLEKARTLNGSEKVLRQLSKQTEKVLRSGNSDPRWFVFHARLLQQKHRFDEAAQVLDETVSAHGPSESALLLQATVAVNQGRGEQAQQACRQLAGIGQPTLAAVCLLDIRAQNNPDEADYRKLQQLRQFSGLERAPETDNWTREILAAMALALGHHEQAENMLGNITLAEVPLSRVALWADIQLALGKPETVLATLTPLIANPSDLDDAILVRLARAETETGSVDDWQQLMAQRVAMREWRGDYAHAAQIALYYLDIQPDAVKALQFARLNWEHGKTWDDKRLLQRASELQMLAN